MTNEQRNRETYDGFARAWNEKDVRRLMDFVADDIVYGASVGPEPGTTYRGREEVLRGFASMLAYDNATSARVGPLTFIGDRLFAPWAYDTVDGEGQPQVTRGIDMIEFRNGRIALKDAFRKAPAQERMEASTEPDLPVSSPTAYVQRRFGSLGTWEYDKLVFKVYGINHVIDPRAGLLPPAMIAAARKHIDERLVEIRAEGNHHGLGYIVLHAGLARNWLLINWWAHGNICCGVLSIAEIATPTVFTPSSRPFGACVWEALPIAHERNAWVEHMLTSRPDSSEYLCDRLPDGLY